MLTVFRKESKVDENVTYDIFINGCLMGKINNGEKVIINMQDKETLNFTLSDELVLKMQI